METNKNNKQAPKYRSRYLRPTLIECDTCSGCGKVDCTVCQGTADCPACDGSGQYFCRSCEGSGQCDLCNGSGELTCKKCEGEGRFTATCKICDGDGICPECNGDGSRWNVPWIGKSYSDNCPACNGTGECGSCGGSGEKDLWCRNCEGTGKIECFRCAGDGECKKCEGQGTFECKRCNGEGKCSRCDGRGYFRCKDCRGKGKVREDHVKGDTLNHKVSERKAQGNIATRSRRPAQSSEHGRASLKILGKIDLESNDRTIRPYKDPG